MSRYARALVSLWMLLLAAAAAGDEYDVVAPGRVVAFGDVHGAYDDWVSLLREVGVIDEELNWSGGDTHLVSLGDLIDRGPGSRAVVQLMMKLDRQADDAGGALHMVLGNHEVMVMTGDLSYVSEAEYAAFAETETGEQREAAYSAYRRSIPEGDEAAARAVFDDKYPPGYFALRAAYAPEGELGRWLMQQPFVLKVNDKVYMHGGISAAHMDASLAEINATLGGELSSYLSDLSTLAAADVLPPHVAYGTRLRFLNGAAEAFVAENPGVRPDWFDAMVRLFDARQATIFSDDSPFWYRGSAYCHPYAEAFVTERFLSRVGASQLVVGHTPSRGRVIERMEGRVIRLDTGMLRSAYQGLAAALISGDGPDYVHYLGGDERASATPEVRSLSRQTVGMSDAEVEAFLQAATVVAREGAGTVPPGASGLTLEHEGASLAAAFTDEDTHPGLQDSEKYVERRNRNSQRYSYDIAAYELDRLLDLQLVPVTVPASVDGNDGALSLGMVGTISERERAAREIAFTGYCSQEGQFRLRDIFDILIHNDDRTPATVLWTEKNFFLRLIDHNEAFRVRDRRPKDYRKAELELSDLFREKLKTLEPETLEETLRPYLHPQQIEAILERRDLILEEAEGSSP